MLHQIHGLGHSNVLNMRRKATLFKFALKTVNSSVLQDKPWGIPKAMLRDTKIAQITYFVHWSFQIELSAAAEAQAIVFFRTTDVGLHKGAVGSQVGAVVS